MWNGTAETLKASAQMMNTRPTTTPGETVSAPSKPCASVSKLVVPVKP